MKTELKKKINLPLVGLFLLGIVAGLVLLASSYRNRVTTNEESAGYYDEDGNYFNEETGLTITEVDEVSLDDRRKQRIEELEKSKVDNKYTPNYMTEEEANEYLDELMNDRVIDESLPQFDYVRKFSNGEIPLYNLDGVTGYGYNTEDKMFRIRVDDHLRKIYKDWYNVHVLDIHNIQAEKDFYDGRMEFFREDAVRISEATNGYWVEVVSELNDKRLYVYDNKGNLMYDFNEIVPKADSNNK